MPVPSEALLAAVASELESLMALIRKIDKSAVSTEMAMNLAGFQKKLGDLPFVEMVGRAGERIQVGVDSGNRRLAEVVAVAGTTGFTIDDISVAKPSLGDVFLKYTGHELRDV